jgi:hypothetical protein
MKSNVLTVKTSSNASTLEGLIDSILLTSGHQTRHFILSELNFLATEGSQGQVCDLELGSWCRHICGVGGMRIDKAFLLRCGFRGFFQDILSSRRDFSFIL